MASLHVSASVSGNWDKTEGILDRSASRSYASVLPRFGRKGVDQLRSGTPVDTGTTAESWYSSIEESSEQIDINFGNTNVNKGFNVAKGLAEGHGTGTGGWVQGTNYIDPVGEAVFTDMSDAVWREVIG